MSRRRISNNEANNEQTTKKGGRSSLRCFLPAELGGKQRAKRRTEQRNNEQTTTNDEGSRHRICHTCQWFAPSESPTDSYGECTWMRAAMHPAHPEATRTYHDWYCANHAPRT